MDRKVATLLYTKDLSLNIRRAILYNYFPVLCESVLLEEILFSKKIEDDLKIDIIHNLQKPLYRWEEQVITRANSLLLKIINDTSISDRIFTAALETLSEYQSTYILDNLDKFITSYKRARVNVGSISDYLVNIVRNKPSLLYKSVETLVSLINPPSAQSMIPEKLLFDLIYRHYRLHKTYQNDTYRDLLQEINNSTNSIEIKNKLPNVRNIIKCDDALLFDYSEAFKTLYFNASANRTFTANSVSLERNELIENAIQHTVPLYSDAIDTDNNLVLALFKDEPENILIIPCLYYENPMSILMLTNIEPSENSFVYSITIAKYIAGAAFRIKAELELNRMYEKVINDYDDILRGLKHDTGQILYTIDNYLNTMKEEKKVDIEMLKGCTSGCDHVGNIIERIVDVSSSDRITDLNQAIEDIILILNHSLKSDEIDIDKSLDVSLPRINNDAGIKRVLQNFIQNSKNALRNKRNNKKINIKTIFNNDNICLTVTDNGEGMKKEYVREKVTKHTILSRKGLGLAISLNIIKQMGGELYCTSNPDGTTMEVLLLYD